MADRIFVLQFIIAFSAFIEFKFFSIEQGIPASCKSLAVSIPTFDVSVFQPALVLLVVS